MSHPLEPPPTLVDFVKGEDVENSEIWNKWFNNLFKKVKELVLQDYNLEVLRGNVPGHVMVSISGHDETLTTTRTTITPTITTANITQSAIAATPAKVKVASTDADDTSAGAGVRTLTLEGLDSSGDAQTETITMNGQTEVESTKLYSAILGWRALTWGATTYNEGTIWVGSGTFTSGVPAVQMFAGEIRENRGNTAYYVVPNGKTLYQRYITINVATTNKDCDFFIETSTNGLNWFTQPNYGMEPSEFQGKIIATPGLPAGSHLRVEGISSASGTDVIVILDCELIDN